MYTAEVRKQNNEKKYWVSLVVKNGDTLYQVIDLCPKTTKHSASEIHRCMSEKMGMVDSVPLSVLKAYQREVIKLSINTTNKAESEQFQSDIYEKFGKGYEYDFYELALKY